MFVSMRWFVVDTRHKWKWNKKSNVNDSISLNELVFGLLAIGTDTEDDIWSDFLSEEKKIWEEMNMRKDFLSEFDVKFCIRLDVLSLTFRFNFLLFILAFWFRFPIRSCCFVYYFVTDNGKLQFIIMFVLIRFMFWCNAGDQM